MNAEAPDFHTRDFLFEEGTLFLFRRRYVDKKIPYQEIELVTFKKGSYLKRPVFALAFGFGLILFNCWIFVSAGFHFLQFFNTGLVFLAAIGAYAIYSGLPIHLVIEIKFNQDTECFSVSTFIKNKNIDLFIDYLREELGSQKVIAQAG